MGELEGHSKKVSAGLKRRHPPLVVVRDVLIVAGVGALASEYPWAYPVSAIIIAATARRYRSLVCKGQNGEPSIINMIINQLGKS